MSCVALDIGFELIVCRFTKIIFAIRIERFSGTDERTKLAEHGNRIAHVENST